MEKIKSTTNNNRSFLIGAAILVVLAALFGWSYFANQNDKKNDEDKTATESSQTQSTSDENTNSTPPPPPPAQTNTNTNQKKFTEKKSAHFVSSDPANNALLTTAPGQVSIKFNFDLGAGSTIEVVGERSGDVVPAGPKISSDLRTLSIPVSISASDNYQVTYKACWADGTCNDGSFGFGVNLK